MDNAGDWINIVIMVAAGVIGLLNSGKKKRRAASAPQTNQQEAESDEMDRDDEKESSTEKSFWELLEEMEEKTKEPTQPDASIPSPTASMPNQAYTFPNEMSPLTKPSQPVKSVAPVTDETESRTQMTITNQDELRKAIIYSEILQRKY